MEILLAAQKLSLSTLLAIGALVGLVIIAWSYSNWRAAVKIAFVAVLLEGAIRKWALPSGQELVYFLKDIFLVGAYIKFYFAPDPEMRAYRLKVPFTLVFLCVALVSFSTMNPNIGSLMLAAYGFKIYFFYLPLTFMMPYLFRTEQEMVKQLTWYALLAIPICLLGVLQYGSDRFSVINTFASGMDETGATGFGVGDRARITGTFSYLTGHTTFVIVFSTLTIVLLSLPKVKWRWILIGVCLPLLAGNALMGGARASIVTMAFVAFGFGLASLSGKLGTSKNFLLVLGFGAVVAVGGIVYLFSDAWAHWSTRFEVSTDGMKGRIIDHPVYALTTAMQDGGLGGYGIGTAHPATEAIRKKLHMKSMAIKTPSYDNELGQVLVELGIVGFLGWYGLRFLLVMLAWKAFNQAPPGVVRALGLAGVLITGPFLLMSVVYNHTANFFIFALAGFALIPLLEPTVARRFSGRGSRLEAPRRGPSPHAISGTKA